MKASNLQEKLSREKAQSILNEGISDYFLKCFEKPYGRMERAPAKEDLHHDTKKNEPFIYLIVSKEFYFPNDFQKNFSKIKSYIQKYIV